MAIANTSISESVTLTVSEKGTRVANNTYLFLNGGVAQSFGPSYANLDLFKIAGRFDVNDSGLVEIYNSLQVDKNITLSGNAVLGAGLKANGTFGTSGYVLKTNGTTIFWAPVTSINSLITTGNTTFGDASNDVMTVNGKANFNNAVAITGNTVTNTILSSDLNFGYKLSTTSKRQLFSAYGFDFKLDNGILTPTNKTRGAYGGGTATSWTVPAGVYYIYVKMWGAGGGGGSYGGWRQGSLGGAGGFSCGLVPVVPGESLTFVQGGRGFPNNGATGAYPDGGAASLSGGDNRYAAAGGGSSRLLVPSIHATIYAMIAGGGGGGGAVNGYSCNSGGAGGGLIGQMGRISPYTGTDHPGKGGTQSAGGAAGTGSNTTGGAGSYLQGGTHQNASNYAGGGGGGYYGGGSGAYGNSNSMGGGGGGSGYIHANVIMGQTHMGSGSVTPFNWDPDYCAVGGTGTINDWGMGGDESGYGGLGLIIFYY